MPDHINDIPLEQLLIYEDGELIFDGSDPDTFVVLEPGNASARLADLPAGRDRRAVPGSPAYERARRARRARPPRKGEPVMTAATLCICGHEAAEHADPASGDTRCLVVGERAELEHVFDDGRDTARTYCACLRFIPADVRRPSARDNPAASVGAQRSRSATSLSRLPFRVCTRQRCVCGYDRAP